MSQNRYVPRNNFVIVRLINIGRTRDGIIIPDVAKEGKELRVVAVGPKVESLKEGDSVLMSQHADTFPLPNESDLFAVKEETIAVVISEDRVVPGC